MKRNKNRSVLRAYVKGKISRSQAIRKLALDNHAKLLDTLAEEKMQPPRLTRDIEEAMIHRMAETRCDEEPLVITAAEFKRHLDFILDILPWEREIKMKSRGQVYYIVSLLDAPNSPAVLPKLVRWRIFEVAGGDRFVMGAAGDGASRGPISVFSLDPKAMTVSDGIVTYQLVGSPGYDDQVQYQLETAWSFDRHVTDVSAKACRELGVPEHVIAAYKDGETPRTRSAAGQSSKTHP